MYFYFAGKALNRYEESRAGFISELVCAKERLLVTSALTISAEI